MCLACRRPDEQERNSNGASHRPHRETYLDRLRPDVHAPMQDNLNTTEVQNGATLPSIDWSKQPPATPTPSQGPYYYLIPSTMKSFALLLAAVAAAASSKAAYDPNLDPVYSTLTPDAPVPTDALVNATGITFGIAIATVTNETVLASVSSYQSQLLGTTTLTSQATGTASSSESSSIASASSASASETTDPSSYFKRQSIKSPSALAMTLNNTILLDSHGRVGSIVANRQFQFDGPPPQAGAIYAAGWGITTDGYLTIGDNDVFFQCLSGSFYNLYDETLGSHCSPVYLETVEFVE